MRVKLISICVCMFVCMFLLLCAGCSSNSGDQTKSVKQTAEAWIYEGDIRTLARIDLTDGWSVEFAQGAVYMYDTEITPTTEAMLPRTE